jgi:hypothetical protein
LCFIRFFLEENDFYYFFESSCTIRYLNNIFSRYSARRGTGACGSSFVEQAWSRATVKLFLQSAAVCFASQPAARKCRWPRLKTVRGNC